MSSGLLRNRTDLALTDMMVREQEEGWIEWGSIDLTEASIGFSPTVSVRKVLESRVHTQWEVIKQLHDGRRFMFPVYTGNMNLFDEVFPWTDSPDGYWHPEPKEV